MATQHFTIGELLHSDTAISKKIDNYSTTKEIEDNLDALIRQILEPARIAFGGPIYVSSGYRSKKLNDAVKGVSNSQHLSGQAADLTCNDLPRLFSILREMNVDQLLYEKSKTAQWIHVSYKRNGGNRNYINNNYKA